MAPDRRQLVTERTKSLSVGKSARGIDEHGRIRKKKRTSWQEKVFMTFDHPHYSKAAHGWAVFMTLTVVLSCVAFMTATLPSMSFIPHECEKPVCVPGPGSHCTDVICLPEVNPVLERLELAVMVIFTIDYVVRMLTVYKVPQRLIYPEKFIRGELPTREPSGLRKTLAYAAQPLQIIDLLALLPFFIELIFHGSSDFLREQLHILRLLRLLRIFKLGRYSEGLGVLINTAVASVPALMIMILFIITLIVTFGTIVYFAEHGSFTVTADFPKGVWMRSAGTERGPTPFTSMFTAAYWVIMTATTIGAPDVYPITAIGRCVSVIVAYLGIVTIAMPVLIIARNFNDEYDKHHALQAEEEHMYQEDEGLAPTAVKIEQGDMEEGKMALQADDLPDASEFVGDAASEECIRQQLTRVESSIAALEKALEGQKRAALSLQRVLAPTPSSKKA